MSKVRQRNSRSDPRRARSARRPSPHAESFLGAGLHPSEQAIMGLQRQVGNSVVARMLAQRTASLPASLATATVPALQRTIGNVAVRGLIAGPPRAETDDRAASPAATGGPSATVQRYPATVMNQPYGKWEEATDSVKSPGRGQMGGVFFLKGKTDPTYGPIGEVVVKPLVGQGRVLGRGQSTLEQSQLSDVILKEFGIDAPDSRPVPPGSSEFNQLKAVSESGSGKAFPEDVNSVKLMAKVKGKGLLEMAGESDLTPSTVDGLVEVLKQRLRLFKLGELMVVDALMGNEDRITKRWRTVQMNLDNIMVTMDSFVAIDSSVDLKNTDFKPAELEVGYLRSVSSKETVDEMLNFMLDSIQQALEKSPSSNRFFNPLTYFRRKFTEADVANLKEWVQEGIHSGKLKARAFATSKDERHRGRRQRIKGQTGREYTKQGSQQTGYTYLKASAKYLDKYETLLEANVSPEEADAQAKQFAQEYYNTKWRERLDAEIGNVKLSAHVQRVAAAGGAKSEDDMRTLKLAVKHAGLSASAQDELLHIRPYGAKQKQKKGQVDVEARLEAVRVGLLSRFIGDLQSKGDQSKARFKEVIAHGKARAKRVEDLRVYEPQPVGEHLAEIRRQLVALKVFYGTDVDKYFPLPTD